MADMMPNSVHSSLPVRAEKCAHAGLRKAKNPLAALERVGACVDRARTLRGWNLDELANHAARNSRQIGAWIKGRERTQFDVLFDIDDPLWKNALVIALAELATGVEIDTVIRLRIKESA
jgi:hypothetical protein